MAPRFHRLRVSVVSQCGHCGNGHHVGEEWIIGKGTPEGICLTAMSAILPFASVLRFTGEGFFWAKDPNIQRVACPDADNPVVFQLERLVD